VAYLADNGKVMFLWLGRGASAEFLDAVFGVKRVEDVDVIMTELPVRDNNVSGQVRGTVKTLRSRRKTGRFLPLRIIRQQLDPAELEFANLLVEDKNCDGLNYVDYLCIVHRQIQVSVREQMQTDDTTTAFVPRWQQWY